MTRDEIWTNQVDVSIATFDRHGQKCRDLRHEFPQSFMFVLREQPRRHKVGKG